MPLDDVMQNMEYQNLSVVDKPISAIEYVLTDKEMKNRSSEKMLKRYNVAISDTNHSNYKRLPDLTGITPFAQKQVNKLKEINGEETTIKGYKVDNKQIITYSFSDGQIYAFAIKEKDKKSFFCDVDNTNKYTFIKGKDIQIDRKAYKI